MTATTASTCARRRGAQPVDEEGHAGILAAGQRRRRAEEGDGEQQRARDVVAPDQGCGEEVAAEHGHADHQQIGDRAATAALASTAIRTPSHQHRHATATGQPVPVPCRARRACTVDTARQAFMV